MPAPAGNCHNTHGRPRRLEVELERLETAVEHVDRLVDGRVMAALLAKQSEGAVRHDTDHLFALRAVLSRELRAIREAVALLDTLTPRAGRRRRRRTRALEERWMAAGAALDRLVSADEGWAQ